MARSLIAAQVTVSAAAETEYLRLVEALAGLVAARGEHLWVFRASSRPGRFLEFREGWTEAGRVPGTPATETEQGLDAQLRQIANYADGDVLWQEVAMPQQTQE
jgi:hypothetical protein